MTVLHRISALDTTRAQNYLTLATSYCRYLGGVRWSDHEDALVYPDGRFFAFNEAIAFFLEGFGSAGPLIHFGHVIHLIDLILDARHLNTPEISRVRHLFFGTGGYWRNAGALAGVLCRGLPEVADPPPLDLVLSRLRDRTFPIRFYAGQFHDTARVLEQPALSPEEFEERLLRLSEGYTDDDLRSWFQNGRGPVQEAGAAIARETPAPRTLLGALAALLERPRLAGAETYVTQLVSALAIPPRRLAHQELPVGGYSDMSNQGNFEAILPGQFALDELEFFRRFAERELLYFRREEPPAQNKQELVILLDQGVRTWGDIRLVLGAAAIALGKQAVRHNTPFFLAATSNHGRLLAPLDTDFEELARLVEASDLSPHPGLALESVLEQTSAAVRDIVLLTHPRNVAEPDVRHAALRLGPRDRLFAVALAGGGQVEMSELRHGATVKVRQFRVNFEPARVPCADKPTTGWTGTVEPIPFPFRFGADSFISHFDFDYDGVWFVTASREGMLHAWKTDGDGLEILPRATDKNNVLTSIQAMVGVAGGVAVAGLCKSQFVVAHYDFRKRRVRVHPCMPLPKGNLTLLYSRAHHVLVCLDLSQDDFLAIDLEVGAIFSSQGGGPDSRAKEVCSTWDEGRLCARDFPIHFGKSTKSLPAGFHVNAHESLAFIHFPNSWPPFVPLEDGRPILKDISILAAQKCQGTAVLKIQRPQKPASLLVLQGPPGVVVAEYPLPGPRFKFQLAQNGAWLARQVGDGNVEVRPVRGLDTVFTMRLGGASHQVRLHLGQSRFLLCVGESHRHLVSWETDKLEILYQRQTDRVQEKWRSLSRTLEVTPSSAPRGAGSDRARFVAEAARNGLTFLADRFGQVAVLDRGGGIVAMFMAFRDRLAAWLPDGTQYGSPFLLNGPPTPAAAEKIATALQSA